MILYHFKKKERIVTSKKNFIYVGAFKKNKNVIQYSTKICFLSLPPFCTSIKEQYVVQQQLEMWASSRTSSPLTDCTVCQSVTLTSTAKTQEWLKSQRSHFYSSSPASSNQSLIRHFELVLETPKLNEV